MRVLIALDRSPLRSEVVAAAAHLLGREDEAILLTVVDPADVRETVSHAASRELPDGFDILVGSDLLPLRGPVALAEDSLQASERVRAKIDWELEGLARQLSSGTRYQTRVEVDDDVASCILGLAADLRVHGIAMGTRGRGRVSSALLGSVALEVLQRSSVPVLIVRQGMQVPRAGEARQATLA